MIPNRLTLPFALLAFATAASNAQTAATTAPRKPATSSATTPAHAPGTHVATTATHATEPPCSRIPTLSPKIPALPAGLPCPRPLYTVVTVPPVRLYYVAPVENSQALLETLGIETSSFSLDYVDTKVGTGELAASHKWYSIHYTGYLVDGTKFDSSVDRGEPISIPYGGHKVIPGWDTGFNGMRVGGKRRLFIPYQLAYGSAGRDPIPPKAELIFDVELVAQSDTEPAKPQPKPAPADSATPPADPAKPATQPGNPPSSPSNQGVPVTP